MKGTDRKSGPYPYYGASGVVDFVADYLFDGEFLLIAEDGENLRTRKTPIAFMASGRFWVNNHAHIVRGNDQADTRFLCYYLANADISGFLTGSTMPKLTQGAMNRIPVWLPPPNEQRRIAAILGALDDKIELNRKMNRTLEEMAQALFKSWFIDFDGHDDLVDSEIGPVPRGWGVVPARELCTTVRNGSTPRRGEASYWEGGDVPWFKTGELTDGVLLDSEEKITPNGLRESACTLFPAGTVLIAIYAAPTVGRLGLLTRPATSNQACTALNPVAGIGPYFLMETLRAARSRLNSVAVGSAQQNISKAVVENLPVLRPPHPAIQRFNAIAEPAYLRMEVLARESQTLATLRDTLLPKLISGELRVPEAEAAVTEAL